MAGLKRRVPGLRREEVAALAGFSIDYYIRLERGALTNASDSVLHTIARALQLDATEQAHLIDLARAGRPSPCAAPIAPRPRRSPATADGARRTCRGPRAGAHAHPRRDRCQPLYSVAQRRRAQSSQPRPVHLYRPLRPPVIARLGRSRRQPHRPPARRRRSHPLRPHSHRPRRRVVHPQRHLPLAVGPPRPARARPRPARDGLCPCRLWPMGQGRPSVGGLSQVRPTHGPAAAGERGDRPEPRKQAAQTGRHDPGARRQLSRVGGTFAPSHRWRPRGRALVVLRFPRRRLRQFLRRGGGREPGSRLDPAEHRLAVPGAPRLQRRCHRPS